MKLSTALPFIQGLVGFAVCNTARSRALPSTSIRQFNETDPTWANVEEDGHTWLFSCNQFPRASSRPIEVLGPRRRDPRREDTRKLLAGSARVYDLQVDLRLNDANQTSICFFRLKLSHDDRYDWSCEYHAQLAAAVLKKCPCEKANPLQPCVISGRVVFDDVLMKQMLEMENGLQGWLEKVL
ncbi:hypothetical protein MKZ38_006985 [Zalerion maritima]|uniref:Uncharacterized protein n=1 Tax=Zalerion maritima TaxID=339359 RepID=A0AAD5RJB1_9PEZI|nr:hypothetical protein MKZ38_006985 [Zalerion maritima]